MSTIHFIGGEKGGVGKSVVARLLCQRFIDRSVPFRAFDADESHGALARHYREFTTAVDLADQASADEILNAALDEEQRVVVDLPAQSDRLLSTWIAEAAVLDLAMESDVGVVFWHVMDDGKPSLQLLERLLQQHGARARYCIVKNHGRGTDFSLFEQSSVAREASALGAWILDLPALFPAAMHKIDRADASFWAAANNPAFGEVRSRASINSESRCGCARSIANSIASRNGFSRTGRIYAGLSLVSPWVRQIVPLAIGSIRNPALSGLKGTWHDDCKLSCICIRST